MNEHLPLPAFGSRVAKRCTCVAAGVISLAAWSSCPALQDEVFGDGFEPFDLTACDDSLPVEPTVAAQLAAALDLCQTTTQQGTEPGLISASMTLADGSGAPVPIQRTIRPSYGSGIYPRRGSALALLSTGTAAGSSDADYTAPTPGYTAGTSSAYPSDWLAANGGTVPVVAGCPLTAGSAANDSVMLTLVIRVPNNARSFSLNVNYLASDFPEYVCSSYDDYFVALLDSSYSGASANPADKNLAVVGMAQPLNVNLAVADAGLFRQCTNGAIGCYSTAGTITTCSGNGELVGTGMDVVDASCDMNSQVGGGTGWYKLSGNVVPGETIELRLAIWDTADSGNDSDVVLDNFRWSYDTITPGATTD